MRFGLYMGSIKIREECVKGSIGLVGALKDLDPNLKRKETSSHFQCASIKGEERDRD